VKNSVFVFGAGASRGAYPSTMIEHGTPLTSDLFSHVEFKAALGLGEASVNLLLQAKEKAGTKFDLEASFAQLSLSGGDARQSELMDIRFAIHEVIRKTASKAFTVRPMRSSFYADLWFRVRACIDTQNRAIFINMNYDTILDAEIAKTEGVFTSFEQYLSSPHWSLIHPHGCISWGFAIPTEMQKSVNKEDLIRDAAKIFQSSSDFVHLKKPFPSVGELYSGSKPPCFPAIAMPVAGSNEKEHFVCPTEQIQLLDEIEKLDNNIDNLILIGWKALDSHVLNKLAKGCRTLQELHIVSFSQHGAEQIKNELIKAGINAKSTELVEGGFENYIVSPFFDSLFPNPAEVISQK
jgi:hypothetical protein